MGESAATSRLMVLAGNANPALCEAIANQMDLPLCDAFVGRFPDGEIDIKINDDVRGLDCFVLQPTCPPVNENWIELLLLLDTLRRASAGRITAVMPYYGYARKDRKDEGRVPISAKVVANTIANGGADRVLTVDMHAAQIQGFYDIPVDHLYAKPVLLDAVRELDVDDPVIAGRGRHQDGALLREDPRGRPRHRRQAPHLRRGDQRRARDRQRRRAQCHRRR